MIEQKELLKKIEISLDTLRPYLEADGGNIEVVEITKDFTLRVKLLGNCDGCNLSSMTMKAGVEEAIKRAVPEIKKVEAV